MAAPSKTVCLRSFNEDLDKTNPWDRQGPTPPPLPKRIAWPGGKIVSNKDEAIASFLRRKLDQGLTLTPEQMAMLERMVNPNARLSAQVSTATTVGGKRKIRGALNGGGVGGVGDTDPRNLLYKLERKVARAPDAFEAGNGGSGGAGGDKFQLVTSTRGRRRVDLSSLKRGGKGAARVNGGGGRRVLPDGHGGFTIAKSAGRAGSSAPQQQRGASSKRPRGVGAGGGRFETTGAATAAAAVAAIPAVYREAGFSGNGKKKNGGKGGEAAGGRGKKGPVQQQQQQQNGGENGGAKAKGISNGRAGGNRSLEELMSGGLAAVRR